MAGRADTYDQRAGLLGALIVRNRFVTLLRFVVPALGVAAFAVLAGQIWLANTLRQYGVAGITIDRGNVVVEAPQYSGIGSNGARYLVTAVEARTPLGRSHEIDMSDAIFDLIQPAATSYRATAASALLDTNRETVTAPGIVDVSGSDGMVGTLTDVDADTGREIVISRGAVDLTLGDGTIIQGSSMVHDGKLQTWTFTDATVIMPDLPKAELGPEAAAPPESQLSAEPQP